MDKRKNPKSRPHYKTYHLDRSWHIRLLWAMFLMMLAAFGIFALILLFPNLWISYPFFACLPFLLCASLFFLASLIGRYISSAHLFTSEEGIGYNTALGYSIYILWENIERIDQVKFIFSTVEGIILNKPQVRGQKWNNWYHRRKKHYHIPITPFVENWQSMELGYYLKPHINLPDDTEGIVETNEQLEREDREEKRRNIQETQKKIRKVIYIGLGIFLITACLWSLVARLLNP